MPAHVFPVFSTAVTAAWLDSLRSLDWRAVVLVLLAVLIVALLVYAVGVLLRLRRLGHLGHEAPRPPALVDTTDDDAAGDEEHLPAPTYAPLPTGLADLKRLEACEREQLALRDEIISLRRALKALREDMEDRIAEVELQARSQHVSPLYGDAMQMALAGHDAATIAERCGIPRGEAELVVALVHQGEGDDKLDSGGRGNDGGKPRH